MTIAIIGFTVLISIIAFNNRKVFEDMLFEPFVIHARKDWFRLLTHGFIHGNYPHLFVNMFVLYMFGPNVENGLLQITGRSATLPFLGEPLRLVLNASGSRAHMQAIEAHRPGEPRQALHLPLPPAAEPQQIRDVVQSWLQRQAKQVFEERCQHFAAALGVTMKRLSLSSAQTRWGSATADGSIRLNWRLIHFGLPVIDYVVAHELAHLREMNHSPAFWEVVRSVVPDFASARKSLVKEVLPPLG